MSARKHEGGAAARALREGAVVLASYAALRTPFRSRRSTGSLPRMTTDRGTAERDLYGMLLDLGEARDARSLLGAILELLVQTTQAHRGYLELYSESDSQRPRWALSQGCSPEEEEEIRAVTSRGIVAAALASGATVHSPYAMLDDRFAEHSSVQAQRLEAVLCARVGGVGAGVLYLEGRRGAGPFSPADVALAEKVARHLGPALEGAARADDRLRRDDPTRPFRERMRLDGIVGRSAAIAHVFEQIEPYTPLDVTLLIDGDTGTGKTQLARAVHDNGPRRNGPFVELNCAAIPEGLIESELFGTMPGAFPGARRSPGKVKAAEGGTLFLDEIAEVPLAAQGKLLQLLQSRQYYALASNKLETANVRLIAATHQDLAVMVETKRFREDLFYRINVIRVRMPSLSERREDIPLLVDELIARIAAEHRLAPLTASERLRLFLQGAEWAGNVRALRHRVEAALIRANAERAPQIEVRHLPGERPDAGSEPTFHEATRLYQRELLRRELGRAGWNVAAVAERLDLTRSHVYNLIHQFELKPTIK
jgi:Nif-specific regulatory protein